MNLLSPLQKQLGNRNFLSSSGFKFVLAKYPKVDFLSNTALIPAINLGVAFQPTYLKDIPIPGDKLTYDDFSLDFIVDEEMENYIIMHNWLKGLGFPESVEQYDDLLRADPQSPGISNANSGQSDGTLIVYNSNFNPVVNVRFQGLFPVSLSTIDFDAKSEDTNYITANVTFKYTNYIISKA
jgi:hypothetical protein